MDKKNNGLLIFLGIIIVLIIVVLSGFVNLRININYNSNGNEEILENNNQSNNENNVENNVSKNYDFVINKEELDKFGKGDYNFVKYYNGNDYVVSLTSDNKIVFDLDNYVTNVSNVKDFIVVNVGSVYDTMYVLTYNGDVYKYDFSDYKLGKYEAKKLDEYSNINRIFEYKTAKKNAGGCSYIVLIDNNGKYITVDSYCI